MVLRREMGTKETDLDRLLSGLQRESELLAKSMESLIRKGQQVEQETERKRLEHNTTSQVVCNLHKVKKLL